MQLRKAPKIQRNSLCPCGSNVKYKKCCLKKEQEQIVKQFEIKEMLDNDAKKSNKEEDKEEKVIQESIDESQSAEAGSNEKE